VDQPIILLIIVNYQKIKTFYKTVYVIDVAKKVIYLLIVLHQNKHFKKDRIKKEENSTKVKSGEKEKDQLKIEDLEVHNIVIKETRMSVLNVIKKVIMLEIAQPELMVLKEKDKEDHKIDKEGLLVIEDQEMQKEVGIIKPEPELFNKLEVIVIECLALEIEKEK